MEVLLRSKQNTLFFLFSTTAKFLLQIKFYKILQNFITDKKFRIQKFALTCFNMQLVLANLWFLKLSMLNVVYLTDSNNSKNAMLHAEFCRNIGDMSDQTVKITHA